jgi:hypothetical protein
MSADPRSSVNLVEIFRDPKMFTSRDAWEQAGFKVPDRYDADKILVASHDAIPGYLFKRYADHVDLSKQRRNYERRIEGADHMRAFIARRQLRRISVPRKWLYRLPKSFKKKSCVLIVERISVLDLFASERAYGSIEPELLGELSIVLHEFYGLDFSMTNAPFTEDGRIAFIDTESWSRHKKRDHLSVIAKYVSPGTCELARNLFRDLRT